MLDSALVKKVEEFVYSKPRSIQEISEHIGKNWRTADRYIDEIEKEYGTVSTRVFRGGTRGALKIVYWASVEKASKSVFQEQLEKDIFAGKTKYDFSAMDIYQHIPSNKKNFLIKIAKSEEEEGLKELRDIIISAKKQLLIFSGNLSFINFKDNEIDTFEAIEDAVKKGVKIKVICRVDLDGIENIQKLLSLNFKYGKELVEIRHREQPLRAIIVDKDFFNIKEVKQPTGRKKELDRKIFLFFNIKDKDWTEWISKIFWKMYSSSIGSDRRTEELRKLNIYK